MRKLGSRSSLVLLLAIAGLSAACAGTTPPPATPGRTPEPPRPTEPAPSPPESSELLDAEKVPPAPPECAAFMDAKPASAACGDEPAAWSSLADALEAKEPDRSARLVGLEECRSLPPGVVRALRAELAPPECADVLVEPFLAKPPVGLGPEVRDALMGLGYAARAARLVRTPPTLAAPFSKERVQKFVTGPLKTWIEGQARAIHSVSLHGSSLEGYGKGVVAVEAGLADLRFVAVARNAPVPEDIAKDSELKEAYYASLEAALEPRKARGRDAALVGLKKLAETGVVADARVDRARKLLSELYAGRRIDALDSLILPPLGAPPAKTPEERAAALLPTFYAGQVLAKADLERPSLLAQLVQRGLPKAARAGLDGKKGLSPEARRVLARGYFALGQRYWRAEDFKSAARALEGAKLAGALRDEAELVRLLSDVLANGPKDAAEMMLRGPHMPKGVGEVAELDRAGKGKGPRAGRALFAAARLLEIARPADADAAYFKGVAERYTKAAAELTDPANKSDALDRAKAAEATAQAIEKK